jgi:hypothetical protein
MAQLAIFEALASSACCDFIYDWILLEAMTITIAQIGMVERDTNASFHERESANTSDAVAAAKFWTVNPSG